MLATSGDEGGCAIHAVFGDHVNRSGELQLRSGARQKIRDKMPADVRRFEELMQDPASYADLMQKLLWRDRIMRYLGGNDVSRQQMREEGMVWKEVERVPALAIRCRDCFHRRTCAQANLAAAKEDLTDAFGGVCVPALKEYVGAAFKEFVALGRVGHP